jgi:hypothetical protein
VDQVHSRWTEAEGSVHREPHGGADEWRGDTLLGLRHEAALGRPRLLTVVVGEGRGELGDSVLVFTGRREAVEPTSIGVEGRRWLVLGVSVHRGTAYRCDCTGRTRKPRGSSSMVTRGGGAVDFGRQ